MLNSDLQKRFPELGGNGEGLPLMNFYLLRAILAGARVERWRGNRWAYTSYGERIDLKRLRALVSRGLLVEYDGRFLATEAAEKLVAEARDIPADAFIPPRGSTGGPTDKVGPQKHTCALCGDTYVTWEYHVRFFCGRPG